MFRNPFVAIALALALALPGGALEATPVTPADPGPAAPQSGDASSIWMRNSCVSSVTFYFWDDVANTWVNGDGAPLTVAGNTDQEWLAPLGWPTSDYWSNQKVIVYRCQRANGGQEGPTVPNWVASVNWNSNAAMCSTMPIASDWDGMPEQCSALNTACCGPSAVTLRELRATSVLAPVAWLQAQTCRIRFVAWPWKQVCPEAKR